MARRRRDDKIAKASKEAGALKARRAIPRQTRKLMTGKRFGGRQKGTPNKLPGLLKDAIVEAARLAGSYCRDRPAKDDLVNYLAHQARYTPQSFLPLLGRVLPMQIEGDGKNLVMIDKIEMVVIRGRDDAEPAGGDDEVLTSIEGTGTVLAVDGPSGEVPRGVGRAR